LEHINSFEDRALLLAASAPVNPSETPLKPLEIVLHLMLDKEQNKMDCGYYFVRHESQLLLWGDELVLTEDTIWEVKGATSLHHIGADFAPFYSQ
jgi:hypothetical protein